MTDEWKRRYGYGGKNQTDPLDDWLIEVKDNEQMTGDRDLFAEKKAKKKELSAKYKYKQLKNMADRIIEGPKLMPEEKRKQRKALAAAVKSDASMGKFSEKLRFEEKRSRGFRSKRNTANESSCGKDEKITNIRILDELSEKVPTKRVTEAKVESMISRKVNKRRKASGKR
ncbi:hypothetical protein ACOME3_004083 [Neoechinorhynchus agilis]